MTHISVREYPLGDLKNKSVLSFFLIYLFFLVTVVGSILNFEARNVNFDFDSVIKG